MIVVQLKGGLGNQLFQYAFGVRMSLLLDRKLALDATYLERRPNSQYGLSTFGVKNEVIRTPDKPLYECFSRWDKYLKYLPSFGSICIERRNGKLMSDVELSKGRYFSGYWQNYGYFSHYRSQILGSLDLSLPPEYAEYEEMAKSQESCSVHVRRGDYFDKKNAKNLGFCTLDYFLRCEKFILNRRKLSAMYVFSDDPDWVKANLKFKTEMRFLPAAKTPSHDLIAFSKPRNRIMSNSTFSWWGAWLGGQEDAIVVAPAVWGGGAYLSRIRIIPTEWNRL
jgi:hypothetical protein